MSLHEAITAIEEAKNQLDNMLEDLTSTEPDAPLAFMDSFEEAQRQLAKSVTIVVGSIFQGKSSQQIK